MTGANSTFNAHSATFLSTHGPPDCGLPRISLWKLTLLPADRQVGAQICTQAGCYGFGEMDSAMLLNRPGRGFFVAGLLELVASERPAAFMGWGDE